MWLVDLEKCYKKVLVCTLALRVLRILLAKISFDTAANGPSRVISLFLHFLIPISLKYEYDK